MSDEQRYRERVLVDEIDNNTAHKNRTFNGYETTMDMKCNNDCKIYLLYLLSLEC